jgi:tetratricopeptide (TPR) repeat protein
MKMDSPERQAYCWSCGKNDSTDNIFCAGCGGRLSTHQTTRIAALDEVPRQEVRLCLSGDLTERLRILPVPEDSEAASKNDEPVEKVDIKKPGSRTWHWCIDLIIAACVIVFVSLCAYDCYKTLQAASVWIDKGNGFLRAGLHESAIKAYSEALKLMPRNEEAYAKRGCAYERTGCTPEAKIDYARAVELNPAYAEAMACRVTYIKKIEKKSPEALAVFDAARYTIDNQK